LHSSAVLKQGEGETPSTNNTVTAIDSGCSDHMCNEKSRFIPGTLWKANVWVQMGDDNGVQVGEAGKTHISSLEMDALFVPQFRISLVSVSKLAKQGLRTTFDSAGCRVTNKAGEIVLDAKEKDGIYVIGAGRENAFTTTTTLKSGKIKQRKRDKFVQTESLHLWHRRLAHLNPVALKQILDTSIRYSNDHDHATCDICLKSKHQQEFNRTKVPRSKIPFELIHSDTCGPLSPSLSGAAHYIVFIDDCTRHVEVYFLLTKSAEEVAAKFAHFEAWVATQGYTIKRFRSDNGKGEYSNSIFQDMLGEAGITWEPSPPYTQHKNGVSERMIRTLNTKARSMLLDATLPSRFWAEAISTAAYLHRRSPSNSLEGKSPFEMLYGVKPKLYHLRRFGSTVYKHIPKDQRKDKKFGSRSKACMMLGYVHNTTKIWRIWDFEGGSHGQGRAMECSNTIFKENENAFSEDKDSDDIMVFAEPDDPKDGDYVEDISEEISIDNS
jgi:transposase InsO family protein